MRARSDDVRHDTTSRGAGRNGERTTDLRGGLSCGHRGMTRNKGYIPQFIKLRTSDVRHPEFTRGNCVVRRRNSGACVSI